MADNDLLYELLINKQKVKSLNTLVKTSDNDNSMSVINNDTTIQSSIIDDSFTTTNQIFIKHCQQSSTVQNNLDKFNTFIDNELPILLIKFEKHCMGKTE